MRFTGKISFITKDGSTYARGIYRDNGRSKQVIRKVLSTKSEARIAVIEEIERRLNPVVKDKTFRDLADYYRTHHCIPAEFVEGVKVRGKKTWKIMLLDVELLEKFFGDKPLKEITRDDIHRYKLQSLDKPVRGVRDGKVYYRPRALATVHHYLRTLRSMFGIAYDQGWIDRIPSFRDIISSASESSRDTVPTHDEVERVLEACNARERLFHCRPILLMIADCGARPIELWQLEWNDLNLEEGWVILTSDKGKRRIKRKMYLTERLKESLSTIPQYNEFVFGGIKSIKKAWFSIQKIADITWTPYFLRHYYASKLKEQGFDLMDIMIALGHTRPATSSIYTKLTEERRQAMARSLSSASQQ